MTIFQGQLSFKGDYISRVYGTLTRYYDCYFFLASEDGLTDAEIKFYWEGMLKGVAVVHRENIVHKDLKPANFLIVEGMLKLIGKFQNFT